MITKFKGINKIDKNYFDNIKIEDITEKENEIDSYIKAGKIHKKIRYDIQQVLKPGVSIYDISQLINDKIRFYTNKKGINHGIAFPPILSVNNCIAHYSPTKKQNIILKDTDNVKIDFGVHVNGYIVDSAFTAYFNDKDDMIHKACKEALYEGLKQVKVDGYIRDVSSTIEEVINSYDLDFKIIKSVCGHNIKRYNIHGGINILNYGKKYDFFNHDRFKKGAYAIEPFISYKNNYHFEGNENNNYRIKNKNSKLHKYFNNLIFTDSHIEYFNINNIFQKEKEYLQYYPSLYIQEGDIGVQYEHSIYVTDDKVINLTKSIDY